MRKNLFNRLIEELSESVDSKLESSDEEKWIELHRGDTKISISFDNGGNHIQSIGVYKKIIQVVDEKRIF